jgi:hypothetical protein
VQWGSVSQEEWDRLLSAGWRGRDDGSDDIIYSPGTPLMGRENFSLNPVNSAIQPAVFVLQLDGREMGRITIDNLLALGKSDGIQYLNAG